MGVLLLIRHGQASLGATDYDQLSPLGRQQARLIGARLAQLGTPIARVICGTLARQRDTADGIAAAIDIAAVKYDERWDEYDHVDILADRASAFVFDTENPGSRDAATYALDEAIQRWMRSATGYAESHDAFLSRVRSVVSAATELAGVNVAVSSAGVIAAACAQLLGIDSERWPNLARVIVNASVTKVITGRSGTSLVTFNDHAHLENPRELITYG